MEFIQKAIEFLTNHVEAQVGVIALILDFVFRAVKSQKPISVLWLISDIAKKVAEFLAKLAAVLDKILPQRLK